MKNNFDNTFEYHPDGEYPQDYNLIHRNEMTLHKELQYWK
jgi:hypothetical protein